MLFNSVAHGRFPHLHGLALRIFASWCLAVMVFAASLRRTSAHRVRIACINALECRIPRRKPMSTLLGCHWQWSLWSRVAGGVVPMGEEGSQSAGSGFNH